MKEWPFRAATGVGVFLAIWVLWGQFGEALGLPRWGFGSRSATTERIASSGSPQEFRWDRVLRAGQTIEIKGINGSVTAELATGRRVEVEAVKTARRSDPSEVQIEVVEHTGGVTICAVYPSSGSTANSCEPADRGHMSTNNNDVQVVFTVRVPKGIGLVARTINGSIKASELESDLVATTVNGSIHISTTGRAEANSVNGSITATLGATDLVDDLEFNTVNGSITVHVPEGLNADVGAETVGGRLASDFPLTLNRRSMTGVLGSGGPNLTLNTVNGSIQLRRAN